MKKLWLLLCLVGPTPLAWTQSSDRELFAEAENRFGQKAWEASLDRYNRLLEAYPLSTFAGEAIFRSGLAQLQLGHYDEAWRAFDTAGQRYPEAAFSPELPYWKASLLLDTNRPAEALPLLRLSLDHNTPLRLKGALLLALARAETGLAHWTEAADSLRQLAQEEGESFWSQEYALTLYFNALSRLKAWTELTTAAAQLKTGLSRPAEERLRFWQAEALTALGQPEAALPLYVSLQDASDPVATIVFLRLFNSYLEKADRSALETLLPKAETRLANRPELLTEFRTTAAILYYKQGQWSQAETVLSQVWSQFPTRSVSGLVPLYLSLLKERAGQAAAGLALLRQFLAQSKDNDEALLLQQGKLEIGLRQWSEAVATFTTLLNRYPAAPDSDHRRLWLALAQTHRSPDAQALDSVRHSLELNRTPELIPALLKIRTGLEHQLGQDAQAIAGLTTYLPLAPQDRRARLDLAGLQVQAKAWSAALTSLAPLLDPAQGLKTAAADLWAQARYLQGMALIGLGRFSEGREPLTEVAKLAPVDPTQDLRPYAAFYLGWSLLKLNPPDYALATTSFVQVAAAYPNHPLRTKALSYAGLAATNDRQYAVAEAQFRLLGQTTAAWEASYQAPLNLGRALAAQGRWDEARQAFNEVLRHNPTPAFAPDAAFELARSWEKTGPLAAATDAYLQVWKLFPQSPLAEESLYHRGELFFGGENWSAAREAYNDYRQRYPQGRWTDAALYWSGEASAALKEPYSAALVWVNLADNFPASRFRAPALKKIADVYFVSGDFKAAQKYLKDLQAADAGQAKALGAQERLDQIDLMLKGQTEAEAKLLVQLSKQKRATTPEGRQAMIDLARLYLFEDGRRLNDAKALLEEVLATKDDPDSLAKAQYLLGEYWYRSSNLPKAGEEFLKVRTFKPTDKDLIASSLYRAAEMILYAGNRSQAETILAALEKAFPKSDWVLQGRKLLGGQP